MPRQSYLQRIAGGAPGLLVLSPPRILFPPNVGPIEAETSMEAVAAVASPAEARTVAPPVEPRPAPLLAQAPLAPGQDLAGGAARLGPGLHAPAPVVLFGSERSVPPAVASGSTHPQALVAPDSPPAQPAEENAWQGVRHAASVPRAGRRAETDDAHIIDALEVASYPSPRAVASPAPQGLTTGQVTAVTPTEGQRMRPVDAMTGAATPRWRPVDAVTDAVTGGTAEAVDRSQADVRVSPPIRLEPQAVAPPPHSPDNGGREAGVRIGSLEVRIVPPAVVQVPVGRPLAAAAVPARPVPLSRGFRSFGLVQG
jgi:hypothetical protein